MINIKTIQKTQYSIMKIKWNKIHKHDKNNQVHKNIKKKLEI